MVGLMTFGDAAWSIEQVLNLRLSEAKGGAPDLYALLEYAAESLGSWVMELQLKGSSDRTAGALVHAAERVKKDEPFYLDEDATSAPTAQVSVQIATERENLVFGDDVPSEVASTEQDSIPTIPEVEEAQMSDADMAAFHLDEPESQSALNELPTLLEPLSIDMQFGETRSGPAVDRRRATDDVPTAPVMPASTVELPDLMSVAEIIAFPETQAAEQKHDDNIKRIGSLEISVPLHNIYLAETDELVRLLSNDLAEWRHEPDRNVNILAVHAAHSLAGSSATVGFESLQEVAYALEMVLQSLARTPVRLTDAEFDALEHSVVCLKQMLQKFALCEMPRHEPEQVQALRNVQKAIRDRLGNAEAEIQSAVPAFKESDSDTDAPILQDAAAASSAPQAMTPYLADTEQRPTNKAVMDADKSFATEESLFDRQDATDPILVLNDELDADLLPVFLEEGNDILPQMGQYLRTWQQDPKDTNSSQSLLRLLHTIKGSARMAGAMRVGQHMHEMESRIEQITRTGAPSAEAIEELLGRLDLGMYLFDQLVNPDSAKPAPVVTEIDHVPAAPSATANRAMIAETQPVVLKSLTPGIGGGARGLPTMPAAESVAPQQPVAQVPMVRVRADILDRLVNQAGEVSISRSRVETEVDTLKQALSELTENVTRLRGQLREIEIQAESQMTSQMAQSIDREFDPLEFDRFTRLQELTRMMAESVNDVASVQQNLTKTIDGATIGLSAQARLTRDLQQDLMRVRMVQFASISERLYRVTRQAAKETDKRVNLDIRGGSVEMDRSVLEKMAGPFEHLLRNAVVHGVESREARIAAGKSEVGEMLVEIRQEGNEVVIQFSDDGQGLNLNRIREKAKATGLLTDDTAMSDSDLKDLIFHPGFSTAQEITELAGRGVGMDVVRSEAAALGGRVAVFSELGKGASFLIQLPLTLAVTQVVLLATGGKTYAVPSVLVEQVQQLKANALAAAYNDGAVIWQGSRVALHYLSALLGDTGAAPLAQQYSPLVILKSGNDRVAIHVDEVVGNREVVVKNIGPQLARMIGVAGATVMGSGDIVLIIDPVPLAQRAVQDGVRAPRLLPSDAPTDMGAVAEMSAPSLASTPAQPVQGLRTQHIVMVVDDSLTVRRVTQRFLTREGYQVVLAKDGVDALEQLQAITPDVMLVDIEMPRMDGFDLTRNIRNDERTKHIPIIMITSRTATKHRNYAMELGVNEYLGKPYQESDLVRLVSGFVNKESLTT
jgi:chemosensory pili system protein ChpA (sensor histidine kinase/response regulator)